jgi:hypothetical protein
LSISSDLPPFAVLRRLASNWPWFAEADIPDFEILPGILVNTPAAFIGVNGRYSARAQIATSDIRSAQVCPTLATFSALSHAMHFWLTANSAASRKRIAAESLDDALKFMRRRHPDFMIVRAVAVGMITMLSGSPFE